MATIVHKTTLDAETRSEAGGLARRDEIAFVVFPAWIITGLFIDGWAHNTEKPENFWTPWHALLYSGFVAGMLWGFVENLRRGRRGLRAAVPSLGAGPERLASAGIVLFAGGGVADSVWHSIFGVEADLEALVSPSHLVLMVGGLLLTTAAARSAWRRSGPEAPTLRGFLPALLSVTLAVAVVEFFFQHASAFRVEHPRMAGATEGDTLVAGLAAMQLTNVLLMGPLLLVLRRWHPPAGSFTLLFGVSAVFMTGLLGFDQIALALPALVGGAVADGMVSRSCGTWRVAVAVPVALWGTWFIVYEAMWGLGWSVELWSGSIALAALGGLGLALLAFPPPRPRPSPAHGAPPVAHLAQRT